MVYSPYQNVDLFAGDVVSSGDRTDWMAGTRKSTVITLVGR